MKMVYCVISFMILTILNISAQIVSTSNGGHWNNPQTWVGGVIPDQNSNVVINGPVEAISTTVNTLTINASGSVHDECCSGRSIFVQGNLTNYGLIENAHGGLWIYVQGAVSNSGTMTNSALVFNGTGDQVLISSTKISVREMWKNPDGQITANSNIVIDSVSKVYLDGDILNMGTYKLTKIPAWARDSWFSGGVIYSNGELDISGVSVMHSNLDGNFTLTGNRPMEFGSVTVLHNLKLGPGAVIQDECCAGRSITIKGDLINAGRIKNQYGGLTLYVEGSVINNGKIENQNLVFSGKKIQYISGTKSFSPAYIWKEPNGQILAKSNIVIDSLTRTYLDYDTLNMGSYKLTKMPSWNVDNWFSGGVIYSNGDLDISGVSALRSNLDGNFRLVGNQILEVGSITVLKNMRVAPGKIIRDECCAGRSITVKGNIENEGTFRDGYGGLIVYVEGNVLNHGTFRQQRLQFSGNKPQHIGGSKLFSPAYIWKDPNGQIFADNDLVIDSLTRFYLDGDTLNMGSYKLTKLPAWSTDNWFSGGTIYSLGELDISGNSVMRSNLSGNFTLTGNQRMECSGISMEGVITIAPGKIITDECCAGRRLYISGSLYNYGQIRNQYGGLTMEVTGNLYNYADINVHWIKLLTNGLNRYISGNMNSALYLEHTGPLNSESILIDGILRSNVFTDLRDANTVLQIPPGRSFISKGGLNNNGKIINEGVFSRRERTYYNGDYDFSSASDIKIRYLDKSADTTIITLYANSTHPKMMSSVKRWWQLQANGTVSGYSLSLYYDENILNGNDESLLELFMSQDSGKTWKKLSNPINTTRDPVNNVISVGTDTNPITEGLGDFILSSSRILKVPSISSSISGRKQIRVGPPNRYTITYWNNDNETTDKFVMMLSTNRGVHIESVITRKIETGEQVEIPKDSLFFDNNDETFLLVQPLGPREVRSFDIILTAEPDILLNKAALEPVTFTAVALWIGGAILEEYISNTIVEGCYEMWRPVSNDESLKDASLKAIKNSFNKAVTIENAGSGIAKKAAEEVIEKTGRVAVWPVMLAKDILDCLGNTVKGMKDYVNGNFDKQGKELQKVTSWDPNAKEGPAGYGAEGFMASAAPMSYTIFFENKKEAQAAAWKIVVVDTLDPNVYDVNSVQFGTMSHSMGVTTQTGNILKWEFVNIELPPNLVPPEGEGWVKFTVKLKENLPTGTMISNRAVIKFDLNPWLATNTYLNTLDFDKPVSTPSALIKVPGKNEVELQWNPVDGSGSGIKNSNIFMASSDGPFTLAAVSDSTSARIPVEPNVLYKFYVLSQDHVGNMETDPVEVMEIITGMENDQVEIPSEFELKQNYPNPFNPSTTISFALPDKGKVELVIFNILGEQIAIIIDQELGAGRYDFEWDASGLASGVYIYHLRYKEKQYTRKMLLLK